MSRKRHITFHPGLILSTRIASILAMSALLVFVYFFGVSILGNAHLSYLRYKMKDTVLVHSIKGGGGSGWVTTLKNGKTVIITNAHVCGLAIENLIVVRYRGDEYITKVIRTYPKHDLCAIEAPSGARGGYSVASSFENGESVYTLGHPYLEPKTITKGELSGVVQAKIMLGFNIPREKCSGETYEYDDDLGDLAALFGINSTCIRSLKSQASSINILPGNSGSCSVNIYGNVVAVAFAANEAGTRSYHVPLSDLQQFLKELNNETARP